MYVGHLGFALGAKGARRTVPLWLLVLATQACDWGDVALLALLPRTGMGTAEMWTHSIPAVLAIAVVFAIGYLIARRDVAGAALLGGVVISHILVDYLTGLKPTWPGGPMIGLQLYDHPRWDVLLETLVIVLGWIVYLRSLPKQRAQRRTAWVMLGALVVLQVLAGAAFEYRLDGGRPPLALHEGRVERWRSAGYVTVRHGAVAKW
ncbi:MAG TPA: hypothetical protein VF166_06530 [Gemmatimonadaceae bacterium]